MRILIVEDQDVWIEAYTKVLDDIAPKPVATIVRSRDEAREKITDEFFDLIVLDLKIPTAVEALDEDPAHGLATFAFARAVAPGTPILVLTGSQAEEFIPDLLKQAARVEIWGGAHPFQLVDLLKKLDVAVFPDKIKAISVEIAALSDVELHARDYNLPPSFDRLVRAFVRKFDGVKCEAARLGGLSGVQVIRLAVTNAHGGEPMSVVAKLGKISEVRKENHNYETLISRLPPEATPRKLGMLEYGAKDSAGIFYQLAEGFDDTAFSASLWDDDAAAAVACHLERLTAPWSRGVPEARKSIKEIRERVLWPDSFDVVMAKHNISWAMEFEDRLAQTVWCCVHGDLHGENALVKRDGSSVLIDYGDVEAGPRSLDPISLEFSLLFHPQSPILEGGWPTEDQARRWFDLEPYLIGCPVPRFVRSAREWTHRAGAGRREIAAAAYSYFLRQLKFDTTDGSRARAFLEGCRALYDAT